MSISNQIWLWGEDTEHTEIDTAYSFDVCVSFDHSAGNTTDIYFKTQKMFRDFVEKCASFAGMPLLDSESVVKWMKEKGMDPKEEMQVCGHPFSSIAGADENTQYCKECANKANAEKKEELQDCGHPLSSQVVTAVGTKFCADCYASQQGE
jgi:hypothetical protein